LVTPWAEKVMERARAHVFSDIGAIVLETDGSGDLYQDIGFKVFKYPPVKQIVREA